MGSETKLTAAGRPRSRLSTSVKQLQGEVRDLESEVRRLHEQLSVICGKMEQGHATIPVSIDDLELPAPTPPRPWLKRVLKKLLRASARTVRAFVKALSPSYRPAHTLRLVEDRTPADVLPTIGRDDSCEIVVTGDDNLPMGRLEDLQRLFATESIDVAMRGPLQARRRGTPTLSDLQDHSCLARASRDLGRAIIVKDLEQGSDIPNEIELRPAGLGSDQEVWRGGPYRVAFPQDQRRAELKINRHCPPASDRSPSDALLIIIDQPLVKGLELRVGAILEAARTRGQTTLISLAPPGQPGDRRLDALEGQGCRTASLGAALHPTVQATVAASMAHACGAAKLWAIGESHALTEVVRSSVSQNSQLVVLWEPLGTPTTPLPEASAVVSRTEDERRRLADLCPNHEVILAPTPTLAPDRRPEEKPDSNRIGASRIVLFADDICPESRPEDAVAVARTLREHSEIRVQVVGDGSMADTVTDLARLFGLGNMTITTSTADLEHLVSRADVLCIPHESPLLTASAAAALQCGTPIVAVESRGELWSAARAVHHPIHAAGPPGDIPTLTETILSVLDQAPAEHHLSVVAAQSVSALDALGALLER